MPNAARLRASLQGDVWPMFQRKVPPTVWREVRTHLGLRTQVARDWISLFTRVIMSFENILLFVF